MEHNRRRIIDTSREDKNSVEFVLSFAIEGILYFINNTLAYKMHNINIDSVLFEEIWDHEVNDKYSP